MYKKFINNKFWFLRLYFSYLEIFSYENYFQRYQIDNPLLLLLQKNKNKKKTTKIDK